MQLSPQTVDNLQLAISVALPLLVGFLTKCNASAKTKSLALALLTAVTTIVASALDAGSLDFNLMFNDFVRNGSTAIMSYYGFLKPTGVAGAVADKTANFGVGGQTEAAPSPADNPRDEAPA